MNQIADIRHRNFIGQFEAKIDKKGRVAIPKDFLKGPREQISLYLPDDSQIVVAYDYKDLINPELKALMSIFTRVATIEQNSRVTIPRDLRAAIGLSDNLDCQSLMFIGTGTNFHIMTPEKWQELKPIYFERLKKLIDRQTQALWAP